MQLGFRLPSLSIQLTVEGHTKCFLVQNYLSFFFPQRQKKYCLSCSGKYILLHTKLTKTCHAKRWNSIVVELKQPIYCPMQVLIKSTSKLMWKKKILHMESNALCNSCACLNQNVDRIFSTCCSWLYSNMVGCRLSKFVGTGGCSDNWKVRITQIMADI